MIKLFFLLISMVQVAIWTKPGFLLAGGETSFFLFGNSLPFDTSGYWVQRGTMGMVDPLIYTFYPLNTLFYRLIILGVTPDILQKILFVTLVFSGMYGMYKFSYLFLSIANRKFVSVIAALFYFFNLYTMTQILRRFIYAGFLGWSYLPIFLYFYIKVLKTGNIKNYMYFLVFSFVFAPAFAFPTYFIVLGIPILIIFIYYYFQENTWLAKKRLLTRLFVLATFWLIVNFWWLYPYFALSKYAYVGVGNGFTSWRDSLGALQGATKYYSLFDITTLRQKFYFENFSYWDFQFYKSVWSKVFSLMVFAIFIKGIFSYRSKSNYSVLIAITVISFFLSAGTNPPLGNAFYSILFRILPILGMLRNSYEKVGVLWLFTYSLFFALGMNFVTHKKSKYKVPLIFSMFSLVFGLLVYPMWNGEIFSRGLNVKVPTSYNSVDVYLREKADDARGLMLPIIQDYGMTLKWGEGEFSGLNPAVYYFNKPFLVAYFNSNKYLKLMEKFYRNEDYERELEDLNIKYLVLNHDYDSIENLATKSGEVKEILSKNKNIQFVNGYDNMELYLYQSENNNHPSLFSVYPEEVEIIKYTKTKPTSFTVDISAPYEFELVFKQNYNPLWKAEVNGSTIDDHYESMGYANAWKIEKTGTMQIDIKFELYPWE